MRAITQDRYGWDAVRLAEVPDPVPGTGEVLIRVRAAAVNPYDWHYLAGTPGIARLGMVGNLRGPNRPVRGVDVSGVVEAVGPEATRFAPGDEVFGFAYAGSFADLTVAPEKHLAAKPPALSHEEAGALPMAGVTALNGLRDAAGLQAGQRIAITGAGGGIGHLAIQLAKWLGAHVTAVCSAGSAGLVRDLGADEVVDYATTDFTSTGAKYDVVFSNGGQYTLRALGRAVTPGGLVLLNDGSKTGFAGPLGDLVLGKLLGPRLGIRVARFDGVADADDLALLAGLVADGTVRVEVSRTYPLEEAVEAVRQVAGRGHARGKLVVVP